MSSATPEQHEQADAPSVGTHNGAEAQEGVSIKDVLQSVFAAALGVQSSKNRERDFKQGSAKVYIAAGLIFTVLFIGGVFTVVQLVLANR